ncbi:MAG: globin domain-containing protein [Rhodomicrobium sp.]
MRPDRLAELRKFFTAIEPQLHEVIAVMYSRLLEAVPEAKPLFKGNLEEQRGRYMHMLQTMIKLTRSAHLWPIGAFTGQASLPVLDRLGTIHADLGITRAHFNAMKSVLSQCCREISPSGFTPHVEEALGFICDVTANALTKSDQLDQVELVRKNELPHKGHALATHDPQRHFDSPAPEEDFRPQPTLH